MTTIQGVPDLGPGLRLHLNENTGGCSQKVVDAVRAFDGPALATYPDFTRRDPRDGGVSRRRSGSHRPDQRPRRRHPAGVDRVPRTSHAGSAGRAGRAADDDCPARPKCWSRSRPSSRTCTARTRWARASCRCRPARTSRFRSTACSSAITPNTRIVYVNNPNNPSGQPIAEGRDSTRSRAPPVTRWCSSTRRITTFSARTSWPKPRSIPTCWSAGRSRKPSASPACASA